MWYIFEPEVPSHRPPFLLVHRPLLHAAWSRCLAVQQKTAHSIIPKWIADPWCCEPWLLCHDPIAHTAQPAAAAAPATLVPSGDRDPWLPVTLRALCHSRIGMCDSFRSSSIWSDWCPFQQHCVLCGSRDSMDQMVGGVSAPYNDDASWLYHAGRPLTPAQFCGWNSADSFLDVGHGHAGSGRNLNEEARRLHTI